MTPDTHDHSAADHEIEGAHSPAAIPLVGNVSNTAGVPLVPLAEPIPVSVESPVEFLPSPEVPIDFGQPFPGPPRERERCLINLRAGCYRITFEPESGSNFYRGSMRVDIAGGSTTISGDLYRFLDLDSDLPSPFPFPWASRVLGGIGQAEIPTTSQTILSSRRQ